MYAGWTTLSVGLLFEMPWALMLLLLLKTWRLSKGRINTERNKIQRRRSNNWAFHQLHSFLEYKGIQSGVEILAVPPAYTSQTCNKCLHIGLRSEKTFKCGNCFWHGDADRNAANVISLLGARCFPGGRLQEALHERSVIRPEHSILFCFLKDYEIRAKAPRL